MPGSRYIWCPDRKMKVHRGACSRNAWVKGIPRCVDCLQLDLLDYLARAQAAAEGGAVDEQA